MRLCEILEKKLKTAENASLRGHQMNSVEIQNRRRLIFKYHSLGMTPHEMLSLINRTYPTSIDTIRRDLRNMDQWLPSMLSLEKGDETQALARIVGKLHLAQNRLMELMYGADNDSALF